MELKNAGGRPKGLAITRISATTSTAATANSGKRFGDLRPPELRRLPLEPWREDEGRLE